MIPAYKEELDDLQSFFYGYRWIQNAVSEYRQENFKLPSLRGKKVIFPEREFAAALMHLYLGGFSLAELADMTAISLAEVTFLRTQIDFMMLVDAVKTSFARHFRNSLLLNEHPPVGYASIAAEYTTFEELVRNQIRFPLIRRMINYANSILDKDRHSLPINPCDLRDFRKLFSFFSFEQSFLLDRKTRLYERHEIIAKEIVWRRLGEDYDALKSLLSTDLMKYGVKDKLKRLFVSSELH